jgi:hypothetical protein
MQREPARRARTAKHAQQGVQARDASSLVVASSAAQQNSKPPLSPLPWTRAGVHALRAATMPPRRDTRSAAAAAAAERATTALSPLPLSVVLHIFSLLPVDCRLRCMEVCRGWRSVLLEHSLWTRLDFTRESGVRARVCERRSALRGLLRCASARAGGNVQSLHVATRYIEHQVLMEVAAANAGALRELHTRCDDISVGFTPGRVEALCGAAPQLRVFAADLRVTGTDMQAARRALRNEAPFGPLRVRHLRVSLHNEGEEEQEEVVDEAGVVALAADVAAHASLTALTLERAPLNTSAALDAVVDAALVRSVQAVTLNFCDLSPASAPALARLLGGTALTSLMCTGAGLLDAPEAAVVLAAALRANSTLKSLTLYHVGVFADPAAAAELLGALTGHASLRVLDLEQNRVAAAHGAAVGAMLAALIAANAPALTRLNVSFCDLRDDGLRPLLEALRHNTHLRKLDR